MARSLTGQEQSAFRQDVEKTKKELQATWDKKRTAKLEATAASKAMDSLKKKMEPLRKKVVVATAVKDLATAKVKALGNQVKAVGKMVDTRTASSLVSASICALASSVLPLNRAVRPAAAAADTAPTPMAAALVTWAKPLPIADRACAPLVTTLTTGVATIGSFIQPPCRPPWRSGRGCLVRR